METQLLRRVHMNTFPGQPLLLPNPGLLTFSGRLNTRSTVREGGERGGRGGGGGGGEERERWGGSE